MSAVDTAVSREVTDADLAEATHKLMMTRYRAAYRWAHGSSRDQRGYFAWEDVRNDYADDLAYPLVMHNSRDRESEAIYRRIVLLMRARRERRLGEDTRPDAERPS